MFLEWSKLKLMLNFVSDYLTILHVDKFRVPEIVNPLFNICYFCESVYSHGCVIWIMTLCCSVLGGYQCSQCNILP